MHGCMYVCMYVRLSVVHGYRDDGSADKFRLRLSEQEHN